MKPYARGFAGGLGGEAAETVAQERAALGSIHALLGALERRQRDAAAAADAQQVRRAAPTAAFSLRSFVFRYCIFFLEYPTTTF